MTAGDDIHGRALTTLLELVLGQELRRVDIESAYDHIAACGPCWSQFDMLTETLTGEKLKELDEVTAEQWLPAAPTYGEQWLLQHRAPDVVRQPGLWRRGRGYVARLAEGVEQYTTTLLVSFQYLLTGPSPVLTHRGQTQARDHRGQSQTLDDRSPLEIVFQCSDLPDLQTTVTLKSDSAMLDVVRPQVLVSVPSRWPDFSGVRVTLDDGTQQIERTTGRAGYLEFDPIPRSRIPTLNFIVVPPRTTM